MRLQHWMAGLALAGACGSAHSQTGVSDDRVSLPGGPGSLEGVGENISLDPNMGVMNYGVGIEVPRGFPGVTPNLRLAYSSGAGSSLVGVGWSMAIPHIERSTFKGLPRYTADDRFTADGGTQLVRLPGQDAVYRARFEGGFVRYTWLEVGDGSEGYWQAEYPDGRVATFGATADGTLVPSARVTGPDGTFRYMVVDIVDVYGHRLSHTYQSIDGYALIRQMDYVFTTDAPEYSVSFSYEDRADDTGADILSDAKAGFDERLTQRLSAINVFSGEDRIRRYELSYESYAQSGGFTRLASVARLGVDGSVHPAVQQFGWSQGLDGQSPFMLDMGNIGVNIGVGRATFIDINGDALPDLVDTSDDGAHQFLLNLPAEDGRTRFSNQPVASAVGEGSGFRLGTPFVQVLDINGDGFADLLDARNGQALINRGGGDWDRLENLAGTGEVSDALGAGFDADDGSLSTLRFMDIDNDKRIDLMRSSREETRIWRNLGADGFEVMGDIDALGYDMAVDGIQMSDMNGDGLLDAVKLNVGGLRYRLNLGHGRWGDEVEVLGLPLDESELELASLDDLNGDGLSDLVVVVGRQVKFAINRNGTVFSQITTLGSADVDGELPLRDGTVTVLMADVNGNGSTDVVWLDAQGQVSALEMFPVRPNQLTRVANSLGMVSEIAYTTSVQEMARDGDWQYTLPHPMQVVSQVTRNDSATGVQSVTRYRYRDGYYDSDEKQFRGFAGVEIEAQGDASQDQGLDRRIYDVGAEDRYRHGRLLSTAVHSADRLLNTVENLYDDCPLADTGDTDPPIRFICMTGSTTTLVEGTNASEHVTLREERAYDGYGNVARSADLGVVRVGDGACAPCVDDVGGPCGADCLGDEAYAESTFIEPGPATGGRWILGLPANVATFGDPQSDLRTENRIYYDGPDFEGLPNGQLTHGRISRVTERIDANTVIETRRYKRDADGNVIESLDALAEPGGNTHRTRFLIDADGLRVTQVAIGLEDPEGQPYELVRQMTYESLFDRVASATTWQVLGPDGTERSPRRDTRYAYDTFGRLLHIARPDDRPDAPGQVFEYDLGERFSRVITRERSRPDGPLDLESVACLDGRGRLLQTRIRQSDDAFLVSGLTVYNVVGSAFRVFQSYSAPSAACDVDPPAETRFWEYRRDASGRVVQTTQPDAEIYGEASVFRTVYAPLSTTRFDAEDTDAASPHADTPTRIERDGLGRVIAVERRLADGGIATTRNVFDGIGRLVAGVDADGNVKRQTYDLLGRVLRVESPNMTGALEMTYDAVGNLLTRDDGRGRVVENAYDGANRLIARFEAADPANTRQTTRWDFDPTCDAALCTNTAGVPVTQTAPGLDGTLTTSRFGYDARGRLLQTERTIAGVPLRFELAYDHADRVVQATYPGGESLSYRYDQASRLISIEGIIDQIEYEARGRREAMTYANGTRTAMAYDALQRTESRQILGADGAMLQDLRFGRDRMGNVLTLDDQAGRMARGATYEYDAWYRTLRSAGADGVVLSNAYDLKDNVIRRSSDSPAQTMVGEYIYDDQAVNALRQAGDMQFDHDAGGFTTRRGAQRLDWDAFGRLTQVEHNDDLVAEYAYANDHRRLVRREGDSMVIYGADSWELRDGIATLYATLGNQRVARIEHDRLAAQVLPDRAPLDAPDGRITAADAWAVAETDDADAVGAVLHSATRRMFMERTPIAWLHHDHLGSVVMATDADGGVLGERVFEPTGAERTDSTGFVDTYGFTGQEMDAATGLIHFPHRLLDPQTGRWLSADPQFAWLVGTDALNPGEGFNVYGYALNSYANNIDPEGLNVPGSGAQGGGTQGSGNQGAGNQGNANPQPIKDAARRKAEAVKNAAKKAKTKSYETAKAVCNGCKNFKNRIKLQRKLDKAVSKNDFSGVTDGELQDMLDESTAALTNLGIATKAQKVLKFRKGLVAAGGGAAGVGGIVLMGTGNVGAGIATFGAGVIALYVGQRDYRQMAALDPANPDDQAFLLEKAKELIVTYKKKHEKRKAAAEAELANRQ